MQVSDVWAAVRRRWYVAVLGLVATMGMAVGVAHLVPPTYQTKALVVLLPPGTQRDLGGNPFLGLNGLGSLAAVLGRAMDTDVLASEISAISPKASYSVGPDASTAGPVLVAEAEDPSPSAAAAALDRILQDLPVRLKELQVANGAPGNTLVSMTVVTRDREPVVQNKDLLRAMILVVGLGIAASVGLAVLSSRWSRRRASARVSGSDRRPRPRPVASREAGSRRGQDPPSTSHVPHRATTSSEPGGSPARTADASLAMVRSRKSRRSELSEPASTGTLPFQRQAGADQTQFLN